jgi:1-acyl-sn-glycerol-3-phosphate acyltransferase
MQKLSKLILKMAGWKVYATVAEPQKSVICVAPHTSNWDFPIGKLAYVSLGRKASFLIKDSWFFFPMGYLFTALGGVPVDRTKKNSVTLQMADEFSKRDSFHLAVTPEGTRSLAPKWKMGLFNIAFLLIIIIACGFTITWFVERAAIQPHSGKSPAYYK